MKFKDAGKFTDTSDEPCQHGREFNVYRISPSQLSENLSKLLKGSDGLDDAPAARLANVPPEDSLNLRKNKDRAEILQSVPKENRDSMFVNQLKFLVSEVIDLGTVYFGNAILEGDRVGLLAQVYKWNGDLLSPGTTKPISPTEDLSSINKREWERVRDLKNFVSKAGGARLAGNAIDHPELGGEVSPSVEEKLLNEAINFFDKELGDRKQTVKKIISSVNLGRNFSQIFGGGVGSDGSFLPANISESLSMDDQLRHFLGDLPKKLEVGLDDFGDVSQDKSPAESVYFSLRSQLREYAASLDERQRDEFLNTSNTVSILVDFHYFYYLALLKLGAKKYPHLLEKVRALFKKFYDPSFGWSGQKFSLAGIYDGIISKDEAGLIERQMKRFDSSTPDKKKAAFRHAIKMAGRVGAHLRQFGIFKAVGEEARLFKPISLPAIKYNSVDYVLLIFCLNVLLEEYSKIKNDSSKDTLKTDVVEAIYLAISSDPWTMLDPAKLFSMRSISVDPFEVIGEHLRNTTPYYPDDLADVVKRKYEKLLAENIGDLILDVERDSVFRGNGPIGHLVSRGAVSIIPINIAIVTVSILYPTIFSHLTYRDYFEIGLHTTEPLLREWIDWVGEVDRFGYGYKHSAQSQALEVHAKTLELMRGFSLGREAFNGLHSHSDTSAATPPGSRLANVSPNSGPGRGPVTYKLKKWTSAARLAGFASPEPIDFRTLSSIDIKENSSPAKLQFIQKALLRLPKAILLDPEKKITIKVVSTAPVIINLIFFKLKMFGKEPFVEIEDLGRGNGVLNLGIDLTSEHSVDIGIGLLEKQIETLLRRHLFLLDPSKDLTQNEPGAETQNQSHEWLISTAKRLSSALEKIKRSGALEESYVEEIQKIISNVTMYKESKFSYPAATEKDAWIFRVDQFGHIEVNQAAVKVLEPFELESGLFHELVHLLPSQQKRMKHSNQLFASSPIEIINILNGTSLSYEGIDRLLRKEPHLRDQVKEVTAIFMGIESEAYRAQIIHAWSAKSVGTKSYWAERVSNSPSTVIHNLFQNFAKTMGDDGSIDENTLWLISSEGIPQPLYELGRKVFFIENSQMGKRDSWDKWLLGIRPKPIAARLAKFLSKGSNLYLDTSSIATPPGSRLANMSPSSGPGRGSVTQGARLAEDRIRKSLRSAEFLENVIREKGLKGAFSIFESILFSSWHGSSSIALPTLSHGLLSKKGMESRGIAPWSATEFTGLNQEHVSFVGFDYIGTAMTYSAKQRSFDVVGLRARSAPKADRDREDAERRRRSMVGEEEKTRVLKMFENQYRVLVGVSSSKLESFGEGVQGEFIYKGEVFDFFDSKDGNTLNFIAVPESKIDEVRRVIREGFADKFNPSDLPVASR